MVTLVWKITRAGVRTQIMSTRRKIIIDDDDDGNVWHRLSHLNTRYEPENEQYINQRHRAYCCINYVLVFAVFMIIFDAIRYDFKITYRYRPSKNWNRRNLVNFQPIKSKLGSVFIRISRNVWYSRSIVCIYQATVLKKSVCVCK